RGDPRLVAVGLVASRFLFPPAAGMGRPPPLMSPAESQASLALGSSFASLRGPPHARADRCARPLLLATFEGAAAVEGSGRWGALLRGGQGGAERLACLAVGG